MAEKRKPVDILLAEDDEDDYLLIVDALKDSRLANKIYWVQDGEQLMDFLHHAGDYADPAAVPKPGIILLDLNMPRKDGREALSEIKSDPALRRIPIIVLTTSQAEEDILRSYDLGVNSFIRKPVQFEDFLEMVKILGRYWFEIVELPGGHGNV